MFKVIVPETNASRHLFFTNKSIQREGMVAETEGLSSISPGGETHRGDPLLRSARSHPRKSILSQQTE